MCWYKQVQVYIYISILFFSKEKPIFFLRKSQLSELFILKDYEHNRVFPC